jgi:hypothetical protein
MYKFLLLKVVKPFKTLLTDLGSCLTALVKGSTALTFMILLFALRVIANKTSL